MYWHSVVAQSYLSICCLSSHMPLPKQAPFAFNARNCESCLLFFLFISFVCKLLSLNYYSLLRKEGEGRGGERMPESGSRKSKLNKPNSISGRNKEQKPYRSISLHSSLIESDSLRTSSMMAESPTDSCTRYYDTHPQRTERFVS